MDISQFKLITQYEYDCILYFIDKNWERVKNLYVLNYALKEHHTFYENHSRTLCILDIPVGSRRERRLLNNNILQIYLENSRECKEVEEREVRKECKKRKGRKGRKIRKECKKYKKGKKRKEHEEHKVYNTAELVFFNDRFIKHLAEF
jgi:hypothetical protein